MRVGNEDAESAGSAGDVESAGRAGVVLACGKNDAEGCEGSKDPKPWKSACA